MFHERQLYSVPQIWKTLAEVELVISEKKEGEGGGDEDKVFYCEGTECASICVWKVLGVIGSRTG